MTALAAPYALARPAPTARYCGLPHGVALFIGGLLVFATANDIIALGVAGLRIYLAEVVIWAVAAPLIAISLFDRKPDAVADAMRAMPVLFVYLLLCGFAALLAMGTASSIDTAGKVKNLLPGSLLCIYLVYVVRTLRDIHAIIFAIIALGIVNAAFGIAQFLTGAFYVVPSLAANVWKEGLTGGYLDYTANGLFVAPNALGSSLVPAFVLAGRFALAIRTFSLARRAAFLLAFIVLGIGLVVSSSKGAIIWGMLGLFLAYLPMRRKFLVALLALFALMLALIAYGVTSATGDQPVSTHTILVRVLLMKTFWVNIVDNPSILLIGDGIRWMPDLSATVAQWRFPTVHNTWFDQVLMFGLFSFVAFAALWLSQLKAAAFVRSRFSGPPSVVADALIGSIIALAGVAFFEPRADGIFATSQILTLLALSACLLRWCRTAKASTAAPR